MSTAPRRPFLNIDDARKFAAKAAIVCVLGEELIKFGCAKVPKVRRARQIAKLVKHYRRGVDATVRRARLP